MAIPTNDQQLVPYSINFNARANASYGKFNLTLDQAKAYTPLHDTYIAAQQAVEDARAAGMRSQSLTATRDAAKGSLLTYGRQLYNLVQVSADVTDADKILLGVAVRDTTPSPQPPPSVRPAVEIDSVFGRTVSIRVYDPATATKRRKPENVMAAWVYSYVGADYPTDPAAWDFNGAATRDRFDVVLPDSVPSGSQVWVCAVWINRKQVSGPVSSPVTTNVQGGGMKMAA